MYFVSKVSCRTEIVGNLRQQWNPFGDKEFSNRSKLLCFVSSFIEPVSP